MKNVLSICLILMVCFFSGFLSAAIPASERAALIALYNATDGDNWTNNSGWKTEPLDTDDFAMPGTESSWYGVITNLDNVAQIYFRDNGLSGAVPAELANLSKLQFLHLGSNQLNGSIPSELGNLSNLQSLELDQNLLSGAIPEELGNMSSLEELFLFDNQLSGAIPVELGNLANLVYLDLSWNQLSGAIPTELENLTQLQYLHLISNQLSGVIPVELADLPIISSIGIGYNALYSEDASLTEFLDAISPGWSDTQTIAPKNVAASPVNATTIEVSWDAITYTGDSGGYRVHVATTSGGSYTFFNQTADKTANSILVSGLSPLTSYLFVVSSRTDPHGDQQNTVDSGYSNEATATTLAPPPEIALSRNALMFGADGSTRTQDQSFLVSNAVAGPLNWSVSVDAAWLGVSPASGSGVGRISVSVDTTGLDSGTYTGTVTVTDPSATNSPQTVAVTLKVYASGGSSAPFGSFATPVDQSTVQSSISVSGWALDDVEVESVKIYRESGENLVYIGDAVFVEGARPDLEISYPTYPLNYRGGWGYMLCTYGLPDQGMSATYTLHAIATDKEGNTTDLGTKTITCDNQHAVKPFGAIATPAQGGEASGAAYRNWGWALTPPPNLIPTDGSTMRLLVDGAPVGYLNYNLYRADVAALFPECLNSDGAAAYYDLDTTGYANGVHTIAWIAVDNAANADGIGSRFFTIVNTSGGSALAATVGGVQATLSADTIKDYMIDPSSMRLSRNGNDVRRGREVHVDPVDGTGTIEMNVLSAIAVELNPDKKPGVYFTGYMQVRDELRRLPIGSTLDAENNLFYWQPAPGFYGEYELVFVDQNHKLVKRIRVRVK